MARSDLVRYQLFLPRPLSERLDALARGPGASKSRILGEALSAWLERKGADEIDLRFAKRLDRISNQLTRIERNSHIQLESLGTLHSLHADRQCPDSRGRRSSPGHRTRPVRGVRRAGGPAARNRPPHSLS